jgi:1,4-dihydroxy-6-naphthoate synthase
MYPNVDLDMREITVGHTPDADDAFMFYGIEAGKVKSPYFKINHVIEDIETLNKRALKHELDVTAISAHAYAYLKNYAILRSGASFGYNYGPVVISKEKMSLSQLKSCTIAIPGKMTSANLLLNLVLGKFKKKVVNFQIIPDAVLSDKVDAGLVIHESQITHHDSHLYNVLDLGAWWYTETDGLPVPLGINVVSTKSMAVEEIKKFNKLFKDSILYGLKHRNAAIDYAMKYGRGQPKHVMAKFVKMYVNDITVDMGPNGEQSLKKMLTMGQERGLLPLVSQLNFA